MAAFKHQPTLIKCCTLLLSIGFIIWLSARRHDIIDLEGNLGKANAYDAFLIIGLLAYYAATLTIYWVAFNDVPNCSAMYLLMGLVAASVAALAGSISLSIVGTVNHSDRLAWSSTMSALGALLFGYELASKRRRQTLPSDSIATGTIQTIAHSNNNNLPHVNYESESEPAGSKDLQGAGSDVQVVVGSGK